MATYSDRILNTTPLAAYLFEEASPPNDGDTCVDLTGTFDGVYHYTNAGLYTGSVGRLGSINPCCNPDGQAISPRGNTPIIAGTPDPGIPNGCAAIGGAWPDLTQGNMTVCGYLGGDPGGALGGSPLHRPLSGGLIGTRGFSGGSLRGWSFYRQGGDLSDEHYNDYAFGVGSNTIYSTPDGYPDSFCEAGLGTGFVLQIIGGAVFRVTWDTDLRGFYQGDIDVGDLFAVGDCSSGNPAQADPTMYIGTQDFNLELSGYWGNLAAGYLDDVIIWQRVLTPDELVSVFRCFAAKYSMRIRGKAHVTR